MPEEDLEELRDLFESRLKLAQEIFGAHVFRYENENGKWELSQPLYDGVMVAIDRLWAKKDQLISARARMVRRVTDLLHRPSVYELIVGRPNTAKAVLKRMDLLTKALKRAMKV